MTGDDRKFQGRSSPGQMGQTGQTTGDLGRTDADQGSHYHHDRAPTGYGEGDRGGVTTRESLGDNRDGLGRDRTDAIDTDETAKLISAEKVIGTPVYNARGERLGTIDSIMLHKISGRVAYAVMSFGGFLGIGERYHPLPWDVLTYDEDKGGYNIDLTPEKLHSAPHYTREELEDFDYGRHGPGIRDYYGVGGSRDIYQDGTRPTEMR